MEPLIITELLSMGLVAALEPMMFIICNNKLKMVCVFYVD